MDTENWVQEMRHELYGNILPFWVRNVFDAEHGGLIGALSHDGRLIDQPRSTVLAARVLWTFVHSHHEEAQRAYQILLRRYADPRHGGFFWSIDAEGKPLDRRKHSYANGFCIYGLVAYWRRFRTAEALQTAMQTFHLLEQHAWDAENGGFLEGCSQEWGPLDDYRLSEFEPNVPKSMNTHLHVLEAYTELLKATRDPEVHQAHRRTLQILLDRIIDPETGHFRLFFERDWSYIPSRVSYGHDIEGAWLMRRAALEDGDPDLINRATQAGIRLAKNTLRVGISPEGACWLEGSPYEAADKDVHWWPQAEAMVGFLDTWQSTGDPKFLQAAWRAWRFAKEHVSDPVGGDWKKKQTADFQIAPKSMRIGPWECPYHHARACVEGISRLSGSGS